MVRSDCAIWVVVGLVGAGTSAFRFSIVHRFEPIGEVPDPAERALRYVGLAVLAALVAPSLPVVDRSVVVGNDRLLAGFVGAGVTWRTESIVWTMVAGAGALVVAQQFR